MNPMTIELNRELNQIEYARTQQELDSITDQNRADYRDGKIGIDRLRVILQAAYARRNWQELMI